MWVGSAYPQNIFKNMNIFNKVAFKKPTSSKFKLKHDIVTSFKMGQLIPTAVMEILPGDSVTIGVENMLRFSPLLSPMMHKVKVETHYFFVPNRILWPEWEKFITGNSDALHPFASAVDIPEGTLGDYMGIPTLIPTEHTVNPLPVAAYMKIFDDYYRDQNLQPTERFVPLVSGNNPTYTTYLESLPLRRAWGRDYFTSALPFAQKGDAVQIPLTVQSDIPVDYTNVSGATNAGFFRDQSGTIMSPDIVQQGTGPVPQAASVQLGGDPGAYDPNGTLTVDVQSEATDINTLRRAFRLQEWLEKNARAGNRYIESLMAHFGVKSSDARLQRAEYIGGSLQGMTISEVLSTAETSVPLGGMGGHGISVGGGNTFNYRSEEHGFIIGIISVRPDTKYQQGLHRMWSRQDKLDYAWPTFAQIGEQEILNKEVYAEASSPNAVFGYTPRYAEYKFMNSRISGKMRNQLAFWHLGRIFDNEPALNEDFITCNPSTRIFAVTDPNEDHIFANIYNNIYANRKLPYFGTPTI